jgi:UDP-N-acetylmuramoyl-tripeptide--D-alanyl-D-alanine ligase
MSFETNRLQDFTLSRIADLTGGTLVGDDAPVTGFATDSNAVRAGDLFLAIRGARVDGHDFVPGALHLGAAGTLAERNVPGPHVLVGSLVEALAKLAKAQRDTFNGPVVGVTGSAGKTTTKEFVAAALSPLGPVLKTEGNRNTEYTAPLLWAELSQEHHAVVVEMSMRGFGQVAHLAAFSRPTIGVITNVGYAHMEMVGSRTGIATAKAELLQALPPEGIAVLWQEDEFLNFLREKAAPLRVLTFGTGPKAACRITDYRPLNWTQCQVSGEIDGLTWTTTLPAVGRHIALNASAAILVSYLVGADLAQAAEAMSKAVLPPMRMQVVELNGAHVLLDTYNASPPSMIAAIETLAELPVAGRRRAVIGEMRELGDHAEESHRAVGKAISQHKLDDVLFVGESTRWAMEEVKAPQTKMRLAQSTEDVREFLRASQPGDAVLVKGSRALELEKAVECIN